MWVGTYGNPRADGPLPPPESEPGLGSVWSRTDRYLMPVTWRRHRTLLAPLGGEWHMVWTVQRARPEHIAAKLSVCCCLPPEPGAVSSLLPTPPFGPGHHGQIRNTAPPNRSLNSKPYLPVPRPQVAQHKTVWPPQPRTGWEIR